MKKHIFPNGVLVMLVLLAACASPTRITGSWVDPEAVGQSQENRTVFIASLSRNIEVRTKLEEALAAQAAKRNIRAIRSTDYFSPDFYQQQPSKDQLLSKIKQSGADAILTVSLINKESETRYVPGSTPYSPFPVYRWYGGFYTYYNYWYPRVYDPGYYVTDKTYFLETNLYDADSDKLIWSAQSETLNPGGIDNFVKEYPKKLVAQMVSDGLLKK